MKNILILILTITTLNLSSQSINSTENNANTLVFKSKATKSNTLDMKNTEAKYIDTYRTEDTNLSFKDNDTKKVYVLDMRNTDYENMMASNENIEDEPNDIDNTALNVKNLIKEESKSEELASTIAKEPKKAKRRKLKKESKETADTIENLEENKIENKLETLNEEITSVEKNEFLVEEQITEVATSVSIDSRNSTLETQSFEGETKEERKERIKNQKWMNNCTKSANNNNVLVF